MIAVEFGEQRSVDGSYTAKAGCAAAVTKAAQKRNMILLTAGKLVQALRGFQSAFCCCQLREFCKVVSGAATLSRHLAFWATIPAAAWQPAVPCNGLKVWFGGPIEGLLQWSLPLMLIRRQCLRLSNCSVQSVVQPGLPIVD